MYIRFTCPKQKYLFGGLAFFQPIRGIKKAVIGLKKAGAKTNPLLSFCFSVSFTTDIIVTIVP